MIPNTACSPPATPPPTNIIIVTTPHEWEKLSSKIVPAVQHQISVLRRRTLRAVPAGEKVAPLAFAAAAGVGGGTITCSTVHEAHSAGPAPAIGNTDDDGGGDCDSEPAQRPLPPETPNPSTVNPLLNIPPELRGPPNWVVRVAPEKIPFNPRTGRPAKADDATTWGTFDQAVAALGKLRCVFHDEERNIHIDGLADGVGFEFSKSDHYAGVDLDNCVDEHGDLTIPALRLINEMDSYGEWSPSHTGVHLIVRAKLPPGHNKLVYGDLNTEAGKAAIKAAGMKAIELYDQTRYFTVTGDWLGYKKTVEDRQAEVDALCAKIWPPETQGPVSNNCEPGFDETDDELLAKIGKSKGADKFNKLMAGDLSLNHGDDSSADFSLLRILAWWTRKDADAMERLFGLSELAKREKWKRPDYRARSIARAIVKTSTTRGRPQLRLNVNLLPFMANDLGNAERMLALFGEDMRYCYAMKKWLVWDERRWVVDEGGMAEQLVKEALREYFLQASAAAEADPKNGMAEAQRKHARSSLNNHPLSSVLSVARSMKEIKVTDLDTQPDLLAFENGVLNLRTGDFTEHRRDQFITKLIHYDYDPEAKCPLFEAFLAQIMLGDTDMVDYLHRALGYSLTGTSRQKAIFVAYGTGDNGKSTLLSTFKNLLSEFSALLEIETLTLKRMGFSGGNNTQADLADLRGARFVMTSEGEENQHLSQATLKRITQGMGGIKSCKKYENPIEFPETHKLWIDTNYRPRLRAADDVATFNRLHLVPFDFTIQKADIDKEFPQKLLAEAEGILAWAVRGAQEWYKRGLDKPKQVQEALDKWRKEDDQIGKFIEACCNVGPQVSVVARPLYTCYSQWAKEAGEMPVSETTFAARMTHHSEFEKKPTRDGKAIYMGLELKPEPF